MFSCNERAMIQISRTGRRPVADDVVPMRIEQLQLAPERIGAVGSLHVEQLALPVGEGDTGKARAARDGEPALGRLGGVVRRATPAAN